jgi:hypothetical protein
MRAVSLQSPVLGLLGLVALGLVAVKLYQGDLTITQAAGRIAVVAGVLVVTERLLLPLARSLVRSGRPPEPAPPPYESQG